MKSKQWINKITNSSAFWMVLSLLISLIMWTYLESREIKPTEKIFEDVKVEFKGLSEDMYILEPSPSTVTFTVSGPSRLVNQLSVEDLTACVDVSGLSAQAYNKKCTVILPSTMSDDEKAEIFVSFTVNSIFTESNISFRLSEKKTIAVDIVGSYEGSLSDHCHIGAISFEPKQLELTGPEYYLNNVASVAFSFGNGESIDKSYTEDSYSRSFTLNSENSFDNAGFQLVMKTRSNRDYNSNSISFDSELSVSMPVYRTEKFRIEVDDSGVKYTAGASQENTEYTVSPSEIELSGIPAAFEGLDRTIYLTPKIDTRSIVDLDENGENFVAKRTLKIPFPEGLSSRSDVTEASLTVTIKDLITKDFKVTNFSVVNPPDGYKTKVQTTSITVTLRGPSDLINSLSADQIVAEIDLKGKAPGSNPIYTPEIKIKDYDDEVGTIGKIEQVSIVFEKVKEES
ncbi:MAG: hypothetical protein IK149_01425 [Oscillospiraceae bacterium]|nr:hypothetical protein [Oscillospiraceae bacterium]